MGVLSETKGRTLVCKGQSAEVQAEKAQPGRWEGHRTAGAEGRFQRKGGCNNSMAANTRLPCDPAIPLPSVHPQVLRAGTRRDVGTPVFTAALSTKAKTQVSVRAGWGNTACFVRVRVHKVWSIHTMEG